MFDLRMQLLQTQLNGALRRAPGDVTSEMADAFSRIGVSFTGWMQKNRLRKSGGTSRHADESPGLFRRTGGLSRGLISVVEGKGDINTLKVTMGWTDPRTAKIALTHEEGRTIKPKGKYLTVPLPAALTPAGVVKAPARLWQNTFFLRSKKGNLLLVQSRGKTIIPLFVLKEQVRIPARLEFSKTWNSTKFRNERVTLIRNAIGNGLRKAGFGA